MTPPKIILDTEVYVDYFLVMFMDERGRTAAFEMFDGHPLDTESVLRFLENPAVEIVTFNGNNYDLPILRMALAGATCEELKAASNDIIENDVKPWEFDKAYKVQKFNCNHIDLIEVAPGQNSLKIYGGRLHCEKLQDLPIEHTASIAPEDRPLLRRYCKNDLITTLALAKELTGQIELRRTMGAELAKQIDDLDMGYIFKSDDLRSKSDAQIAESVLKQRVFVQTGAIPRKRPIAYKRFNYVPPVYVQFRTADLQQALDVIKAADFKVKDTGHVEMPQSIDDLDIRIGQTQYKLGIGGIHSQESEVTHKADETTLLRDIDVRSYYPNLMLNMGMYPDATGPHFLVAYRDILTERLAAKDAGEKVKDAALKITLNGTFGKTSSQYSVLYNPSMMLHTTLTGQLSMLMLIEALETRGIPVVSANTDGVVVKCPRAKEEAQRRIVKAWEAVTNLETEETNYSAIYARDVNSYVAVKLDGSVKTKGFFAKAGLAKSPQNEVCIDALIAYLSEGTPLETTIYGCRDIRKFLTVRRVTGGAVKDGLALGKAIRWYYSTAIKGTINYASNGNVVPLTAGARPCMDLPEHFPSDVDHEWYVTAAQGLLMDIGLVPRSVIPKLPRANSKIWKEFLSQGIVEIDEYGKKRWAVPLSQIPQLNPNDLPKMTTLCSVAHQTGECL